MLKPSRTFAAGGFGILHRRDLLWRFITDVQRVERLRDDADETFIGYQS